MGSVGTITTIRNKKCAPGQVQVGFVKQSEYDLVHR